MIFINVYQLIQMFLRKSLYFWINPRITEHLLLTAPFSRITNYSFDWCTK